MRRPAITYVEYGAHTDPDTQVFHAFSGHASPSGGTTIFITGYYLSSVNRVTIDGIDALSFTVINDRLIQAIAPGLTARPRAIVRVYNPMGVNSRSNLISNDPFFGFSSVRVEPYDPCNYEQVGVPIDICDYPIPHICAMDFYVDGLIINPPSGVLFTSSVKLLWDDSQQIWRMLDFMSVKYVQGTGFLLTYGNIAANQVGNLASCCPFGVWWMLNIGGGRWYLCFRGNDDYGQF
jgi:hypothetical protein